MSRIAHLILGVVLASRLVAAPADVSSDLAKFTQDGKVPGLVAAAVLDGKIIATGATGIRKYGDKTAVTVEDKFHIGSCTKSMTGSLAAMLVADGKIKWSTTVEEIFPKLKIHPDFKSATLLQLCSNTGGAPHDVPPELWKKAGEDRDKSEASQRMNLVRGILTTPPAYPPGGQNVYSNSGFTIAGAMLEKVSGLSYQELILSRLFKPLRMDSAGFGAPATPGKVDQPYGHILREGEPFPIPSGLDADNPPAITPAGRKSVV